MRNVIPFVISLSFGTAAIGEIHTPLGYYEYKRATGDLNHDQMQDLVIIWATCKREECIERKEGVKIKTEIYLKRSKDFELISESDGAVCFYCGGVKGEPIVGSPSITKKGILEFDYEGGSRWTWSYKMKWRLERGDKIGLIGSTYTSFDSATYTDGSASPDSVGDLTFIDINFSTRNANLKVIDKSLREKDVPCEVEPGFSPPEFSKFRFEDFDGGLGPCINRLRGKN